MRNIKLVFYFAFMANPLNAQHILFLKSGDKITGKVDSYKKDTLSFLSLGNKLKFYQGDVASIFFDTSSANNQKSVSSEEKNGKITGVVTYFFNKNFGDKPDVGAEVNIISSLDVPDFNFPTVDSFLQAKVYRQIQAQYVAMNKQVPDYITSDLKRLKVESQNDLDSLDLRAARNIGKVRYSSKRIEIMIGGDGNYSIDLKPGTYFVIVKSSNRKGLSVSELSGKIGCKSIEVKSGKQENASFKFDLY